MNFATIHKTLWAGAIGTILAVTTGVPAGARDNLRDPERQEPAAEQAALQQAEPRKDNRQQRQRLSRGQQESRIVAERRRAERYRNQRPRQHEAAAQRTRQLQQQKRMAQQRYEQQYYQRLREQQARWDARRYNPYNDPYFHTPARYRYSYDGRYYRTNRHGADLMRQAVNYGYQEGLRAGRADREDGWRSDYRNSYGYRDALYGYYGYYLAPDQYRYYFRQGFRRGYEDGYYGRYRYGRRDRDGTYIVLAAVLAAILGLELLD